MTVFQLDRMNIASALTGGFGKDIHIDQSTVNLGNQLMFLGIIVLEMPSNIVLQKVSRLIAANNIHHTAPFTNNYHVYFPDLAQITQ